MIVVLLLGLIPFNSNSAQDPEWRDVVVVAPSITCFSRFRDSLKKNVAGKNSWIRDVEVTDLHKKVVKKRPHHDWGNDVSITFKIKKDRAAKELVKVLLNERRFTGTEFWVLESGHRMSDIRDVPFSRFKKEGLSTQ